MNITNDLSELNAKVIWRALGKLGHMDGATALEAAENFYAKYPKARADISVSEVISYDLLDINTGKRVPMIKSVFGTPYSGGRFYRFLRKITKANYKEKLAAVVNV